MNPDLFDLNLIPALPAPNIIPHTLALMDINIHGHWPRLLGPPEGRGRPPAERKRFCSFIVSNGAPPIRRQFFNMLHVRKPVDSWGAFQNTMQGRRPSADQGTPEYFDFLGDYRFMIAFENTAVDYYLTEKLINAYAAGCIPIYWGCPQVAEMLNPKAFLWLKSPNPTVDDMARLIEQILELDNDPEAMARIQAEPLFLTNPTTQQQKIS